MAHKALDGRRRQTQRIQAPWQAVPEGVTAGRRDLESAQQRGEPPASDVVGAVRGGPRLVVKNNAAGSPG